MAALRRSDDLRREMVANISHDLRSPLASIQGYIETILMKADALSDEAKERYLTVILDNTVMLNRLVSSLFELSKLDALEVQPRPEPFSVAELAQDVVMKFKPQADQLQVALTASLSQHIPMVVADIGMIERVLSNLIDNALRYTPTGGAVYVGLSAEAERVRVSVSDTGYGIPEDEIPHICERLYRVEKSRARSSGGAGLGLAIAHKILDLHDAALDIESTVNVGTTISFLLPRLGQPQAEAAVLHLSA
jgi:signal transduction histidine kinase